MAQPTDNTTQHSDRAIYDALIEEKRRQLAELEEEHEITFDDYADITSKMAVYSDLYQDVRTFNQFETGLNELELDDITRRAGLNPGNH